MTRVSFFEALSLPPLSKACRRLPMRRFYAAFLFLLLGMSPAFAQIDTTLFGDNLGPAIPDRLDTGEDWMVIEEEPQAAPAPAPAPAPVTAAPGLDMAPELVPEATSPPPSEIRVPEAASSVPKKKRSWLPWRTRKQREEDARERLDAERAKYGPRMSGLKSRSSTSSGGLDSTLKESEIRRWQRDPRKAMAQAKEERKLLLLWISDSVRSGSSKPLSIEVFRHTKFLRMMKEYMVLTRLDFGEPDIASHKYSRHLKDKLKVMGYPVLILFSPDSEELWRYVGYRSGRFPEIIDQLGYRVEVFARKENHRYEQLLKAGYRDWSNRRKEKVFAKAVSVSREEKTVVFKDEKGKKYTYPVVELSEEDREWLAEKFFR